MVFSTNILYEQGVACDPLHGLEEEAGQRHSLTAVVGGYLLLERRQTARDIRIHILLHLADVSLTSGAVPLSQSKFIHISYLEEVFEVRQVVGFALQQGGGVELTGAETDVGLHV